MNYEAVEAGMNALVKIDVPAILGKCYRAKQRQQIRRTRIH